MKTILAATKSETFMNGESIELFFSLFATYNEGMKCYSQLYHPVLVTIPKFVTSARVDRVASIYNSSIAVSPSEVQVYKYCRDHASFHFKDEFLRDYIHAGFDGEEILLGIKSNDNILLTFFLNSMYLHLHEIGKLIGREIDEKDAMVLFEDWVTSDIHPTIIDIEHSINVTIAGMTSIRNSD
jgi:hypothetical protein